MSTVPKQITNIAFLMGATLGMFALQGCGDESSLGGASEVETAQASLRNCGGRNQPDCPLEPDPEDPPVEEPPPDPDPTPRATEDGTVVPVFSVINVLYAPPGTAGGGSGSSVRYGQGYSSENKLSMSRAFKKEAAVSSKTEVGLWMVDLSATFTAGTSKETGNESEMRVKNTVNTSVRVGGPPVDGIDHNRDVIWFWVRPMVSVKVDGKTVHWKLASSAATRPAYVYVGWLNGATPMPPQIAADLRSWGITPEYYPELLKANPFASVPATAVDPARFGQVITTIPYEPPYSAGDPQIVQTYTLTNEHATTQTSSKEVTYNIGASLEGSAGFLSFFKETLTVSGKLTWTHTAKQSLSREIVNTAELEIGTPSFDYRGSTLVSVYWDSLYNTFMFAPGPEGPVQLQGELVDAASRPRPFQEVVLTVGGFTQRTFSNRRGQYRFVGVPSGSGQIEVKGARQPVLITKGGAAPARADFRMAN